MTYENFTLELVTPIRKVAQATVTEAQIPVLGGYIGVLPGHTPLLAEMGCGELTYRMGNQTLACTAIGGFVEVMAIGTAVKKMSGLSTQSDVLLPQAIIRDRDTFFDKTHQPAVRKLER